MALKTTREYPVAEIVDVFNPSEKDLIKKIWSHEMISLGIYIYIYITKILHETKRDRGVNSITLNIYIRYIFIYYLLL